MPNDTAAPTVRMMELPELVGTDTAGIDRNHRAAGSVLGAQPTVPSGGKSAAALKKIGLKVGLTPNDTDEYAISYINQKGRKQEIEKVLLNLLFNAFKCIPREGCVSLRVQTSPEDQEHCSLSIEVSDTGSGILPEELPHIFDRFFKGKKAHSAERICLFSNVI